MMNFSKIIFLTVLVCVKLPAQGLEFLNGKKSVTDVATRFPAFGKITNFTGTLIDSSWVLTCEHCGGGEGTELEINGQKHKVDKKITHPLASSNPESPNIDLYNLALLHLEKPVTNLKPVRRYRGTLDDLVGKVAWLLGKSPSLQAGTGIVGRGFNILTHKRTKYLAAQVRDDIGSAVFMNIQDPMSQKPPLDEKDFYDHFALIGIYNGENIAPLCRPKVNNWIDNTIIAWALGQKDEAGKWVISLSKPKLEDAPSGLLGFATDLAGQKSIVALIDSSWLLVHNKQADLEGTVFKKNTTIELDHELYKIQNVEPYPQPNGIRLIQLDRPYLGAKPIKRARVTGEEYKNGYPIFYWNYSDQLQEADKKNRTQSESKIPGYDTISFNIKKHKNINDDWVLSKTNEEYSLAGFEHQIKHTSVRIDWYDKHKHHMSVYLFGKEFNTWIDNTIIKYALKQK